jgi:IS5 family transposase
MGWFFGFKLHLIINDCGEILSCKITPGNVDDRTHLPSMAQGISGQMFGDKGYIKKELFEQLLSRGLHLVIPLKSNMKNKRYIPMSDKLSLRKRSVIQYLRQNQRMKREGVS